MGLGKDNAWHSVQVGDLIRSGALVIGDGYRVTNAELGESGTPFVRGGDIRGGWVYTDVADHIRPEFEERISGKLSEPEDVAFITKGTVGRVGFLRPEQPQVVFAPQVCYWRVIDRRVLCPRFVYYLLQGREFQANLEAVKTHGSMLADYVSLSDQRRFRLTLPPTHVQERVAEVMGALDDKIEINRQMNQTLEVMARALFKSWFVDFEAVREAPFQESALGRIPEGWTCGALTEMVNIAGGGTPSTKVAEYWGGEVPWFSVVDCPSSSDVFVIKTEKNITHSGLENSSARLLPFGATIITARGTVGKLALVGTPMAMNQSCYGITPREGRGLYFTYFVVSAAVAILQQRTHGSVFDTITRETLDGVLVVIPPVGVTQVFDRVVSPLLKRILINLRETETLAALRTALLPKLLSGEIRVKQAEKVVGEAV